MPRILPLIASATEIVHLLGQTEHQVGRSHECDYPEQVQALPVCTRPRIAVNGTSAEIDGLVKASAGEAVSIYEIFDDVLDALQPTHILTQVQCEVCAVSLRDVERSVASRLASKPRIVALNPASLSDIWQDFRNVGEAAGVDAQPVICKLQQHMKEVCRRSQSPSHAPSVACIEWLEP